MTDGTLIGTYRITTKGKRTKIEPGNIKSEKDSVNNFLRINNLEGRVQVKADIHDTNDPRIEVYATNDINRILAGYKCNQPGISISYKQVETQQLESTKRRLKASKGRKDSLELQLEELKHENNRLQADYEEAMETAGNYETENNKLNGELTGKNDTISRLEKQLSNFTGRQTVPITTKNFASEIKRVETHYRESLKKIVTEGMYAYADLLKDRSLQTQPQEVVDAREALEKRDKFGKNETDRNKQLELLDSDIADMMKQRWKEAQTLVNDYEKRRAELEIVDVPVILAKNQVDPGKRVIILPIYTLEQLHYQMQTTYTEKLEGVADVLRAPSRPIDIDYNQPLVTMTIGGNTARSTIKQKLSEQFRPILEETKVEFSFVELDYVPSFGKREAPPEQMSDYLQAKLDAGMKKGELAEEIELNTLTLNNLLNNKPVRGKTIDKLVNYTGFDEEKIRAMIKTG